MGCGRNLHCTCTGAICWVSVDTVVHIFCEELRWLTEPVMRVLASQLPRGSGLAREQQLFLQCQESMLFYLLEGTVANSSYPTARL